MPCGTPPATGLKPGEISGRSFLPVLRGEKAAHREKVFATHSGDGNINYYPSRSVRLGTWKYIRNLDSSLEFHTHIDLKPQDTNYWPSWVEHRRSLRAGDALPAARAGLSRRKGLCAGDSLLFAACATLLPTPPFAAKSKLSPAPTRKRLRRPIGRRLNVG